MRTKKTTKEEPVKEVAPIETKNEAQESKTTAKSKKTTTKRTTLRKPRTTKKSTTAQEAPVKAPEEVVTNVVTAEPAEAMLPHAEAKQPDAETKQPDAETKQPQPETIQSENASLQPKKEFKGVLPIPALPDIKINDIIELAQAPQRAIVLTDQQIQQLTLDELEKRYKFLEATLANVLDYDIVISDTNIWLELLIGHTSSHSDPRVNARLQFERQLEFISKLMKHRGGKFMIMGETYEEIDRFAAMQDPTNHKEADFTDNIVCLNAAARLAKRLILAQQRENRLRIEGISAESHHASFADPAIVHRVVELFAEGKKVLLITNDASVAIRSIGLCDDLQRINNISDADWNSKYATIRPMVFTFDDLRLLDYYTRQLYYIQMACKKSWMEDIPQLPMRAEVEKLTLWQDAFRPGDKHRGDNLFIGAEPENVTTQKQQSQQKPQQKQQQKQKQKQQQQKQEQQKLELQKQQQQETVKKSETQPAEPKKDEKEAAPATEIVAPAQAEAKPKKPRRRPARAKKAE